MSRENARYRVLIVDDDESVLLSLEWLLETEGHETTLAWSGADAQVLLASRSFDLVLLDANLRDVSAAEVVSWARSIGHTSRCILLEPSTRLQQIDSVCKLGNMAMACGTQLAAN
ncbi:MAG: response regulator [Acidobacteriia bacterium]|nr:response regulator [Terriglobia bacterium]